MLLVFKNWCFIFYLLSLRFFSQFKSYFKNFHRSIFWAASNQLMSYRIKKVSKNWKKDLKVCRVELLYAIFVLLMNMTKCMLTMVKPLIYQMMQIMDMKFQILKKLKMYLKTESIWFLTPFLSQNKFTIQFKTFLLLDLHLNFLLMPNVFPNK